MTKWNGNPSSGSSVESYMAWVADGNINNASLINCLGQVAILTILKHFHILGNFPHNQSIPDSTTTVPCTVSDDDDDVR